jgi:oligopeptide transport system permease protein
VLAACGPWLTPPFDRQFLEAQLLPPSFSHLMGTDHLGRDVLARVLYGGRISLLVGLVSTLVSIAVGTAYGCVAGFFSRKLDMAMMRVVDVLYSLPYMFLVIILIFLVGKNLYALFLALGLVQWLTVARVVRGQVLSLRNEEFVAAARVLGVPRFRILLRHILPNVLGIVVVYATLTVPAVVIQESFLSFLGLNVAPCTWGVLISEGKEYMISAWWMLVFPGGTLTLCLLCLNLVGDSFRDAFDPKLR